MMKKNDDKYTFKHDEGIAIMGGNTANVYDDDGIEFTNKFTKPLLDIVEKEDSKLRLYGVCFGFQSIAKALGAEVVKSTNEVGLFPEKITRISNIYKGINQDITFIPYTRGGHVKFSPDIRAKIETLSLACTYDYGSKIRKNSLEGMDMDRALSDLLTEFKKITDELKKLPMVKQDIPEQSPKNIEYSETLNSLRDIILTIKDGYNYTINTDLKGQPTTSFNLDKDYADLASNLKKIVNFCEDILTDYENLFFPDDVMSIYEEASSRILDVLNNLVEASIVPFDDQPVSAFYHNKKVIFTQGHPEINFENSDDVKSIISFYEKAVDKLPISNPEAISSLIRANIEKSIQKTKSTPSISPNVMLNILTHHAKSLLRQKPSVSIPE